MSRTQFFAAAFSLAFVAGAARAQSDASAPLDVSGLPIASAAAPAVLSSPGAVFVVRGVQAGAYATVYTLERVADGARVNVEVATRGLRPASVAAGATVTATLLSTGVVLTAASEAIAYVPNALGRALLHTERVKA
jgi:hypothetical protein